MPLIAFCRHLCHRNERRIHSGLRSNRVLREGPHFLCIPFTVGDSVCAKKCHWKSLCALAFQTPNCAHTEPVQVTCTSEKDPWLVGVRIEKKESAPLWMRFASLSDGGLR